VDAGIHGIKKVAGCASHLFITLQCLFRIVFFSAAMFFHMALLAFFAFAALAFLFFAVFAFAFFAFALHGRVRSFIAFRVAAGRDENQHDDRQYFFKH